MMIERRKMTRATYQALKRYILLEREKKKQGYSVAVVYDILKINFPGNFFYHFFPEFIL